MTGIFTAQLSSGISRTQVFPIGRSADQHIGTFTGLQWVRMNRFAGHTSRTQASLLPVDRSRSVASSSESSESVHSEKASRLACARPKWSRLVACASANTWPNGSINRISRMSETHRYNQRQCCLSRQTSRIQGHCTTTAITGRRETVIEQSQIFFWFELNDVLCQWLSTKAINQARNIIESLKVVPHKIIIALSVSIAKPSAIQVIQRKK